MPFDPNNPVNGVLIDANFLRGQFNGLKDLIDAVPGLSDVVIDSVTTLPAGSQATASASMTGTVLHLTFGIPEGATGAPGTNGSNGSDGAQGPQGQQGEQGPPGEVTLAALSAAISGTAMNPTSVSPMNIGFSDPPTQADLLQVQNWANGLLAALFRTP